MVIMFNIANKREFKNTVIDICTSREYRRHYNYLRKKLNTIDAYKGKYLYIKDNDTKLLECLKEIEPLLTEVVVGNISNGGEYPTNVTDLVLIQSPVEKVDTFCEIVNRYLDKVHYGTTPYVTPEYLKSDEC